MAAAVEFTWEQKVFIVRAFACQRSAGDILDVLNSVYGVKARPDDVLALDPNYRILSPDLHKIFTDMCAEVKANPAKANPLLDSANQELALANAASACLRRGVNDEGAKFLEQLAKLQNGFYAGRSAVKGGGGAVTPASTDVNDVTPKMTAEQAAEAYASTLNGE